MSNGAELGKAAADRLKGPQAAEYLGIGVSTLEKMRNEGRGPRFVRLGGRCLYRKADLDAFIEGNVVETRDSRKAAA